MKAEKGKKVSVEYTGSFDDGEVFDTNKGKQPLVFISGMGMVIPGFDKAVEGMEVGETKKFKVPAAEAYGEKNNELIKTIPKPENFPPEAKEGMLIGIGPSQEMQIPALIKKITDTEVTLDLNHPLAGKDLNFEIKILNVEDAGDLSEMCSCSHEDCSCEEECEECSCEKNKNEDKDKLDEDNEEHEDKEKDVEDVAEEPEKVEEPIDEEDDEIKEEPVEDIESEEDKDSEKVN